MNTSSVAPRHRFVLSDAVTFWGLAAVLGLFMFAASAPSPLYQIYAAQWHFSSLTLTVVFALYAIALLTALLVTGRLSDHLGRRPVILGAITIEIASMLCFVAASGTVTLGVARVLQGLGTGAAIGALGAALVEMSAGWVPGLAAVVNSAAPTFGLGAGGLGAGLLVQYGPAPTHLVYWLIVAGLIAGTVLTALMRESGQRRPGARASLTPRVSLPAQARSAFLRVIPCLVALWALSGFYLSLVPGLAAKIAGSHNLIWGGLLIFLLCCSGGVAVILAKGAMARTAMLYGCIALFIGVGLACGAIAASSYVLFLVGSVIGGVGFGLSFLGAFRAVSGLAAPSERAGTIALIYIVSYLAFSIPIVIAGAATTRVSSHVVALVFSAVVAILAAMGAITGVGTLRKNESTRTTTERSHVDLVPCPGTVLPPVAVHSEDQMPAHPHAPERS